MNSQKEIFKSIEGDKWFDRNLKKIGSGASLNDPILRALKLIGIKPEKVLETGCANGFRLNNISKEFNSECYGIDPSDKAIQDGRTKFPVVVLQTGTADNLPFKRNFFDLIIFGFCLYLCDRNDLFKIASEADRCLDNLGYLIIMDFYPPFPYKNAYSHYKGIYSYKMKYGDMFKWNPAYNEIFNSIFSHSAKSSIDMPDERVAITVLRKNNQHAYLEDPFMDSNLKHHYHYDSIRKTKN